MITGETILRFLAVWRAKNEMALTTKIPQGVDKDTYFANRLRNAFIDGVHAAEDYLVEVPVDMVPATWQRVPVVANHEMLMAGYEATKTEFDMLKGYQKIWQAMLRTAPFANILQRWQHVKRRTYYVELGRGKLQITGGVDDGQDALMSVFDGQDLVIYQGDDGNLWARPVSEFEDGRFLKVAR